MNKYHKTKICPYYEKGACKFGPNCHFAHSYSELRNKENLAKTKICPYWKLSFCNDPNCRYAHDKQELRFTEDYYKTRLCIYWQKGKCNENDNCRHAHGLSELRTFQKNSPQIEGQKKFYVNLLQSILAENEYTYNHDLDKPNFIRPPELILRDIDMHHHQSYQDNFENIIPNHDLLTDYFKEQQVFPIYKVSSSNHLNHISNNIPSDLIESLPPKSDSLLDQIRFVQKANLNN